MNKQDGLMVVRMGEIDTRPPFHSVKEGISLFGDKVLAPQRSATNHNHIRSGAADECWRVGRVAAELEETRQDLQRAREESMLMAHCLSSLREELECTKQELQQLKQRDCQIEDAKFVENFEIKTPTSHQETIDQYVTFSNPPSVPRVILPQGVEKLERHPSLRKKSKKPLIPLIGALFSRKKGNQQVPN